MSRRELRKTFVPSYFSMEDILASQTRIPCQTTVTISKFGFLDPSQESPDLLVGSQVELPLWAARTVCKQKRKRNDPAENGFISIKMPKYFNDNFREVLKADPSVVDLTKMGPYYYQSGLQLCTLPIEDSEFISEILPEIFQKRLMSMADSYSLNKDVKTTEDRTARDGSNVLRHNYMDPLEHKIYIDSKVSSDILDDWLRR